MNYKDNFYEKYLKYKLKYNILKYNKFKILNNMNGGNRYDCIPNNNFKDICIEKNNGKYKTKEGCINDCETLYIRNEIKKIKIDSEASKFYFFVKDIIKNENIDVYLKGGNVLGLKVLKMIYDKYKNNIDEFKKIFKEFLKLELIKVWDFAGYTKKEITLEYREKLDGIALKYKLHQRAKTFILYQTKKPILLEEKPLFEISVLDSDSWSKLEIPLTTMKVKINEYNIKYVFMFCKLFYSFKNYEEEFDYDILFRMLDKINILIYPHKNGLYNVTNNFDKGELNDELIKFIKTYNDFDKNMPQFLATHIEDPFRILYRLPEKNIPKNDKIKEFLKKNLNIKNEEWLFDSEFIKKMIKLFCENLGKKLVDIYKQSYIKTFDIKKSIESIDLFLNGVSFSKRIQLDYDMLTNNGKNLLKLIFQKLIDEIEIKNINLLEIDMNLFKFIKFYANQTN
jgi:hypothetical protein